MQPDLNQLVERLKKEKQEIENIQKANEQRKLSNYITWKEKGSLEGKSDTNALSFVDFLEISKTVDSTRDIRSDIKDVAITRLAEKFISSRILEYMEIDKLFNRNAYTDGWLEAVMKVWEQVKDQL